MRSVKGQVLPERGEFSRHGTASRILAGAVVGEASPLADTERGGVIAQKKERNISLCSSPEVGGYLLSHNAVQYHRRERA